MSSIREQIIHNIKKHGHMVMGVGGDATTASFAYTIGLTSKFNCELLVCGLPWQYSHPILNSIAAELSNVQIGTPTEEFSNLPLLLMSCDHDLDRLHSNYVVQADHFYGKRVNVIQVILSDREGRLPMHSEFDQHYMANFQPLFVSAFKKLPVV